MSKRSWHWKDGKGEVHEEQLDVEQGVADDRVLQHFEALERDVSKGIDISNSKVHAEALDSVADLLKVLPPKRRDHWKGEMRRITGKQPDPAAPAPISDVSKDASKDSTSKGSINK